MPHAALLHRYFERFEIQFADGLFIGERGHADAVGFLIVEGEVLYVHIHALALRARNFGRGSLA